MNKNYKLRLFNKIKNEYIDNCSSFLIDVNKNIYMLVTEQGDCRLGLRNFSKGIELRIEVEENRHIQKLEKQIKKVNELLRRVYNVIELSHLNDRKLIPVYINKFNFPRRLGSDIFNYLQSKDEIFKSIVIKRQKKYRKKEKRVNNA